MGLPSIDYKDLPTDFKRILLNIVFIIPFWYICIYYFNYTLIKEDLVTTFIYTFCLSFIISLVNIIFTITSCSFIFVNSSFKSKIHEIVLEVNTIICIVFIVMSLHYNVKTHLCFYNFILNTLYMVKWSLFLSIF